MWRKGIGKRPPFGVGMFTRYYEGDGFDHAMVSFGQRDLDHAGRPKNQA